jgi:hypothetical protein
MTEWPPEFWRIYRDHYGLSGECRKCHENRPYTEVQLCGPDPNTGELYPTTHIPTCVECYQKERREASERSEG